MSMAMRPKSNDLWADAAHQLSDDDKRNINFSRPDKLDILAELLTLANSSKQEADSRRWRYTRKSGEVVIIRHVFEKIVHWVDLFREIGDAAVQYDPGHAALPWAGVRFILQIAVNDVSTYGFMVEGVASIAEIICRYAVAESLYPSSPTRSEAGEEMARALVKMYAAVLVYLSRAKTFFEQGSAKRAIKSVFVDKSHFESYFKAIREAQQGADQCMTLVDRQAHIHDQGRLEQLLEKIDQPLSQMSVTLQNIEDNLQASKRVQILRWISSEPYIQHHEQIKKDALPGTGAWLLQDLSFRAWKKESASSVLWLRGIPGSGKSTLVSIVIEEAIRSFHAGQNPSPAFFYCSRNPSEPARSDPAAVLASLVRQLSTPWPGSPLLKPATEVFYKKEAQGFASGPLSIDESCDLVVQLSSYYPLMIVVIDALDECASDRRGELFEAIEKILRSSTNLVKIFVSGRNDQDIVMELEHYPNLTIKSEQNHDDLAKFVVAETDRLVQKKRLLRHCDKKDEMTRLIIEKVTKGAGEMFRWASLQLQYLCSFIVDADICERLGRNPPILNTLYSEVYDLISNAPAQRGKGILDNALSWLLCAQRPLSRQEFLTAVSILPGKAHDSVSKEMVLDLCNNFVVFDDASNNFRFSHLSVREFLENKASYGTASANALVAEICLLDMISKDGQSSASGQKFLADKHEYLLDNPQGLELEEYSAFFWPEHCRLAADERTSGGLKDSLSYYLLSCTKDPDSPFNQWQPRHEHCSKETRLRLDDVLVSAYQKKSNHTTLALLVTAAFDLYEFVNYLKKSIQPGQDLLYKSNGSFFQIAAKHGNLRTMEALIDPENDEFEITDELLGAAVERKIPDSMEFLLDRYGHAFRITPGVVHTAASDGTTETMKLLLDRRGHEISITEKVAVHATQNEDTAVIELLLDRRGDEIEITDQLLQAAIKDGYSTNTVKLLLERRVEEFVVSETVITMSAENMECGSETMALLLDRRGNEPKITELMLIAAANNGFEGEKIMKLLLDRRENEVKITEAVLIAAAKNETRGRSITKLLFDRRENEFKITEAVLIAAAQNIFQLKRVLTLLFDQRENEIKITEAVLIAAAQNRFRFEQILTLLFDQQENEIKITEAVLIAAAQNSFCAKASFTRLLDQPKDEIKITEAVLIAAAQNIFQGERILTLLFDQRGDEIKITEAVLIAAAKNETEGRSITKLLFDRRENEFKITEAVLIAAAQNIFQSKRVLTLLFDQRENEIKITEAVLITAAQNRFQFEQILTLLFDQRENEIKITEAVLIAAAQNSFCVKASFTRLLDQPKDEIKITEAVLIAAAQNFFQGERILTLLFDQRGDEIKITEAVLIAAAQNPNSAEILPLLFDQRGDEVKITEGVLMAASQNKRSGREVMTLILDRRRGHEFDIPETFFDRALESWSKYGDKTLIEKTIRLLSNRTRDGKLKVTDEVVEIMKAGADTRERWE